MKLTLHLSDKALHAPAAAFIRGGSAMEWMHEISRYKVPIMALDCYILPLSVRSVDAAGLFVIFKQGTDVAKHSLPDAYGVLAGKMYLPIHATLYPQLSEAELEKILLWPVQVFHPSIGFIGFEEKDKLDFTKLFAWTLPQKTTWRHAHEGLAKKPLLQQIIVEQPTTEEVIEKVKDAVERKPLEDIPGAKEDKEGVLGKIGDAVKHGFFRSLSALGKALTSSTSANPGSGGSGSSMLEGLFSRMGFLDKFINWVAQNLEEIEKKRQSELQRLSDLFDKNSDEALQYAIPLNSPYMDRGTASPSGLLSRRSANFNLNNIGGGGRVDSWDIGEYYHTLRSKYLASAQAAIAKGDFKKAAYVYAHLLGDLHSAANVLMQGSFYREAAALYKDHLKDITAAAECLEKGGLLAEATALYLQLERLEKAGDLYRQMEQKEKSDACYEQVVSSLLNNGDNLEASRIIEEKMAQTDRAKQTLLAGWEQGNKAEACLMKYYDVIANTEKQNLPLHLDKVFAEASPSDGRFLNVLVHVRQRYNNADVEEISKRMAYEIVSRQAAMGITSRLHELKTFLPDDQFISSDTSRYVHSQKKSQLIKPNEQIKLNPVVKWVDATWYRNQVIAIGIHNNRLQLARANWYGNIEYYSWENTIDDKENFLIECKNSSLNTIILRHSVMISIENRNLPKNKYFNEEIRIQSPAWLDKRRMVSIVANDSGFVLLEKKPNPTLKHYTSDGKLVKSVTCSPILNEEPLRFEFNSNLFFCNGHYFADGQHIAAIKENGSYVSFRQQGIFHGMAVSSFSPYTWIVIMHSGSTGEQGTLLKFERDRFVEYNSFDILSSNSRLRFISLNAFIAYGKIHVGLYEIENNTVFFKHKITVESPIIEAIPVPHENRFGLVHQNGTVSIHNF